MPHMMKTEETTRFTRYEEVRILSGGVPIVLSIWKADKHAPCLVFHPGTMASPLLYGDLLQRLRERGFTVLGIHHLSHGKSPRINKKFTFQDMLQNGLDAVGYAIERFETPVVLMGHSQGGILSLAQAGRDTRLAAVIPHCFLLPELPEAIEVTRLRKFAPQRDRLLRFLARAAAYLPRFPVIIPMYLDLARIFAGSGRPVPADAPSSFFSVVKHSRMSYPLIYLHSLFSANLDYLRRPGALRCPVLALVARDDALFTARMQRALLEMVQAEQKELVLLSGGGHMAPFIPDKAAEIADIARARCAGLGLFRTAD